MDSVLKNGFQSLKNGFQIIGKQWNHLDILGLFLTFHNEKKVEILRLKSPSNALFYGEISVYRLAKMYLDIGKKVSVLTISLRAKKVSALTTYR